MTCGFYQNGVDVGPHFLIVSKRTLKKIIIILLSGSSSYFGEKNSVPAIICYESFRILAGFFSVLLSMAMRNV